MSSRACVAIAEAEIMAMTMDEIMPLWAITHAHIAKYMYIPNVTISVMFVVWSIIKIYGPTNSSKLKMNAFGVVFNFSS